VKLGVVAPYRLGPVETGAYACAFARLVEELGFESVWAVEHVVVCEGEASRYPYHPSGRSPFDARTPQPDPLVWLSHVAAATRRVRLGTGVLILPQRNPVVLAKALASLDRLSGGRVIAGVGLGWARDEAEAVGIPFEGRARRAEEAIGAMRALWRDGAASFRGEHVRFERAVCEPRPLQPGGVPIVIGGASAAAARRAGRLGDGFYPIGIDDARFAELRAIAAGSARESGRDPAGIELTRSGPPDPALARRYRDQGVDRMVVFPPTGDLDALGDALGGFLARQA
jgi:probable F420-dependent oxidoreductase